MEEKRPAVTGQGRKRGAEEQLYPAAMASADLRDELTCSICLSIYTDPVTLPCGHSFCRLCIGDVMDTLERSGAYTCPECRAEFQERPSLVKVRKLHSIAESFRSTHPEQEETGILCTYCIHSPVPARKTCLHCEASLCENHLRVHSKSPEHVLTEPTASLGNWKCSVHKKVLEYYCCEDAACICVSCSLAGEHRGHQVETLNEASERKKETLRNILQKLTSQREETEKRAQSLEELKGKVQVKTAGVTEGVNILIKDIKKRLEALEKRVLSEISRQEEQALLRVSDLIGQLEIKKEELSRKMDNIKELCDMTDPLAVLQGWEFDRDDYCDADEDTERHDIKVHDAGDLDVGLISVTLQSGLAGIVTGVKRRRRVPEALDMLRNVQLVSNLLLDINTADNYVSVSQDLKTVSWSGIKQNRPERPERFHGYQQVLSSKCFASGRRCWEVQGSESGWWEVGMAYHSIARSGIEACIGNNKRSWGFGWKGKDHRCYVKHDKTANWLPQLLSCRRLGIFVDYEAGRLSFYELCESRYKNQYSVRHDSKGFQLPHFSSSCRLGILLDYEAGRLSFYELCDPVRHLYTFTAAFTEPLHVVFGVYCIDSWVKV
uniref:Uncharacterized protein n=1 Tax=Leptobrachium leishanense TaxID=445787 RepID=A0A8C5MJS2_9ANUR